MSAQWIVAPKCRLEPDDLPRIELRWICEDAWHDQQDFLWKTERLAYVQREELRKGRTTSLYVVFDERAVKFGVGANPGARVRNLQVSNPRKLVLYAAIPATEAFEKFLHRVLGDFRVQGEWFELAPPVLAICETVLGIAQQCEDMQYIEYAPDAEDSIGIFTSRVEEALLA